ncbi:P protein-like [Pectinophora gossypiella]|uniref:P protein-like n=1 Tax=Pectinophora gossypiella TaxID=13191 RepID=UPI00214F5043|nr:P protein-like [Pectinophora gossypiella]
MSNLWKSLKEWSGVSHGQVDTELVRSRYSLVSTGELTEDTLRLWLGLPEEVRFDPALEPFRKLYEKEHGKLDLPQDKKPEITKRLPLVKSAPVLEGNHVEDEVCDGDSKEIEKETREEKITDIPTVKSNQSRLSQGRYYTKMTLLLGCWLFFTVVFLIYNEKDVVVKNTALAPKETNNYTLSLSQIDQSIRVKVSGPFLSDHREMVHNSTELDKLHKMKVWVENSGELQEASPPWTLYLQSDLDFNAGVPRSTTFKLPASNGSIYSIIFNSTSPQTIPFTFSYMLNPLEVSTGVIYALILLTGLYILIVFEVINRTMAAIITSTTSLAVLSMAGERPPLEELVSWLDAETLLLLFSMMLLVAIMAETGIFDFLAVYTFQVTKGKLWPLIFLLCGITAVLSTFLDNVTTVLLMSPVTIRLCEVMDLNPVPILMFMAIYSNIGGTATPVGDPPCVIVASNKAIQEAGINFTTFTAHMSLGILLVFVQATLQFRFMFRDTNKLRLNEPRDVQDLRNQISIWRRAADSLPGLSADVAVVKERLERKISKLQARLQTLIRETSGRACPSQLYTSTLLVLKGKYKIRDKVLLAKAAVAITFVVVIFFMHSIPELNRVSLGWTALLGAMLLLILADREDLEPILHRVEWSTLLFFAALFVLMEALSKLGLILYVGGLMEQLIMKVDESSRLAVAIVLTLWVSGVISAFVDNIPLTTMMVRVVVSMGTNPNLNLPMGPLVWALLFGACLGGNGTLIGASANVVCAGVAEQHGYKFTFTQFFKTGFPVMVGHLVVGTVYLLVCHCVFAWH